MKMLGRHGKAFSFSPEEIRCVDPKLVEPMVLFTIPHVPWILKPILVPRERISQLYSGYNQFQLAVGSRDITSIRNPIG